MITGKQIEIIKQFNLSQPIMAMMGWEKSQGYFSKCLNRKQSFTPYERVGVSKALKTISYAINPEIYIRFLETENMLRELLNNNSDDTVQKAKAVIKENREFLK